MKKILFPFVLFTSILFLCNCNKEKASDTVSPNKQSIPLAKENGYGPFETLAVSDQDKLAMINSYTDDNVSPIMYLGNDVVFGEKYFSTRAAGTTITAYYSNSEPIDNVVFSRALIYNSDSSAIVNYLIVKTTTISESYKTLAYFTSNNALIFEVGINTSTGTVEMLATGQQVADCITDFYSNQGWLSVGLWVGTLFDPGIGACVASACIVGQSIVNTQ